MKDLHATMVKTDFYFVSFMFFVVNSLLIIDNTVFYVDGGLFLTIIVCPGFKNLPSVLEFHLRKSATRTLNFSEIAYKESPLRTVY